MSNISKNIQNVRERVTKAAIRSGRNPDDVRIIAVSKTVGKAEVLDAYENAGQIEFGENRVQELLKKYDRSEPFKWHLIGHLQTNKVKYVVDKTELIHSVDSIYLAEEIEKQAEKISRVVPFLLQVNVSGEESKFGITPEAVEGFVIKMSQYRNIRLEGLMTMAPNITNMENVRKIFKELHTIYIDISREKIHNIDMKYLSMGMSNDFEIAVEEGANLIRVGTSIFTKE